MQAFVIALNSNFVPSRRQIVDIGFLEQAEVAVVDDVIGQRPVAQQGRRIPQGVRER